MENLKLIGSPSTFTCPDCGGVLFELDGMPVRYRCHTGHAFSLRSLAHVQEELTDSTLWAALRALQEKEAVLRRLAAASFGSNDSRASAALHEADQLAIAAKLLQELVEKAPAGLESFDILA
jgi:two-component system chemotaxis response regulator CheB